MTGDTSSVGRVLERIGRFSARNPRVIFVASLAVFLVAAAVAAAAVQLNMGVLLYVNDGSETAGDWAGLESEYDRGNVVFVVVDPGERSVTDPETVRLIDRLDDRYTGMERISSARSLADVVRLGAGGRIPDTERGVQRAIERVAARGNATRSVTETVRPGTGETILLLSYGNVSAPPESGGVLDLVATKDSEVIERRITAETGAVSLPASTSVTITGASIFENAALRLMVGDVLKLFAGGFVLVLVAVYLVMRRRLESGLRALLSLGTTLVALVVMLGAMGAFGYDFNAIMMSVLPVGLGLGVDYGLQIQTRYSQERDGGRPPVDAAGVATRTTGRTLLLAAVTTVVGFGSLLLAPIPPLRQFGVTAGTSVVASMVLSVTLLVALLVTLDDRRPGSHANPVASGRDETGSDGATDRVDGLLETVADTTVRAAHARPLVILIVVLPAAAGGAVVYSDIETTQQMLDYWPQDLEERAEFERTTGSVASPKTVYVLVDAEDPYDPATFREVASFQRRITGFPEVNAVGGPVSDVTAVTGGEIPESDDRLRRLVAEGARSPLSEATEPSRHPGELLLTLHVEDIRGTEIRALIDRIEAAAAETDPGTEVSITGKPVVNRVIIENVTSGFVRMTVLSFTVALVVLAVAFRSARDSFLLLVSVPATTALLMLGAMYLLEIPWNPGTVSMSSIALGIGIDYGLHVHERYRELLESTDLDELEAMRTALRRLSRPVFGSGLTTLAGFGVLLFSRFPVVRNFGKTLVLVIAFSLLATFAVFPATTFLAASLRDTRLARPAVGTVTSGNRDGDRSGDTDPGTAGNREPGSRGSVGTAAGAAGSRDRRPDDGGAPARLVLRARGRALTVGDGDVIGREVREVVLETDGSDEAVWIHPEHVRFVRENGEFSLVNLGDDTTRVNGRRLRQGERRPIGPGDELSLSGVITVRVERPGD